MLLSGDRSLSVFNIAWGEDMGDDFEHLTSNISPSVTGASVDLFFTDEVVTVSDRATDGVMWEASGIPTFR